MPNLLFLLIILLPLAFLCVLVIFCWRLIDSLRTQVSRLEGELQGISHPLETLVGNLNANEKTQQAAQFKLQSLLTEQISGANKQQSRDMAAFKEQIQQNFHRSRTEFDQHQLKNLKLQQDSLQSGMREVRLQVTGSLDRQAETMGKRIDTLTNGVNQHLKEISGQVERRLVEGFEKTTATFTDVIKRLALIDAAQKQITELSNNVVSLQEILTDKRSRGAFGEMQLRALIRNVIPESHLAFEFTLSNGKRVDCMLFLPAPTGNIAIDAKFPLEAFRVMMQVDLSKEQREVARRQFRQDVRAHISAIAEKYIIPNETAEGAMMFLPAEAIFAEIHAYFPELIEEAHRRRVWLVSPTTLMAVLTTARAVLKDVATQKQVHVIQKHLGLLGKDFDRFQKRMDNLARHIRQANDDVQEVHTSASKISTRFSQIERVELPEQQLTEPETTGNPTVV